jgi:hypothetical protein
MKRESLLDWPPAIRKTYLAPDEADETMAIEAVKTGSVAKQQ